MQEYVSPPVLQAGLGRAVLYPTLSPNIPWEEAEPCLTPSLLVLAVSAALDQVDSSLIPSTS